MPRSTYPTLYHRVVANSHEPASDQGCWSWKSKRDRWGYGRLNIWVPGLNGPATFMAHIALWVWLEAAPQSVDEFYLAYIEFTASGLELDHACINPRCISPDHLAVVTGSENCQLRNARARLRVNT